MPRRVRTPHLALLCMAATTAPALAADLDQRCAAVAELSHGTATISQAKTVTRGELDIDGAGPDGKATLTDLPPFCRIAGTARPVPGSHVGFEAWLPTDGWNRRLLMIGNGGYSSALPYATLAVYLRRGYAVAATDTGHTGDDPDFARGNPESIVDWGHRAVHVTRTQAHAAARSYFGAVPAFTYFAGCSTGGHQALMAAQRYPEDFDGIVAGAPGHNRTHLNAGFLWQFLVNHSPGGGADTLLSAAQLGVINEAVLMHCRQYNGRRSGGLPTDAYLDDPLACDFDPRALSCDAVDGDGACLASAEIDALEAIYDGPRNPRTGERIYFGQAPGSETAGGPPGLPGWSLYWADPKQPERPARASFWQYWVFDDPDWDWRAFDFDADMQAADDRLAATINAMNPDLRAFRDAGGRLIHFHGLNDPVVPAADSISYFERANAKVGGAGDFYRLFLAPGVEHCRGGPGPDSFDLLKALEEWVEDGHAPDRVIASKPGGGDATGEPEFSRPLCPYPAYAVYDGTGDPRLESSFECRSDIARPAVPDIGSDYLR